MSPSQETALKKNTDIMLSDAGDGELYKAAHDLHDLFAAFAGIAAGHITDQPILLASGKAVSPIQAAFCLLEFKRTSVFLKGIYQAILHLQQVFSNQKINILYAGCGPFATLLTPLTTRFSPAEVGFILMDINQVSLDAATRLYEHLGLNNYITRTVLADASVYKLEPEDNVQLVISETMQQALKKEPQVAIMLNLIPQLPSDGIFIPEEISVSAKITSAREEAESFSIAGKQPRRIDVGLVYSIGAKHAEKHSTVTLALPEPVDGFNQLDLFTDITVYQNEKLTAYNCSLNLPVKVCSLKQVKGKAVSFTYVMTDKPRFDYHIHEGSIV